MTPAVALWSDKDLLWESMLPKLADALPELLILGSYAPGQRTGPVSKPWGVVLSDSMATPYTVTILHY